MVSKREKGLPFDAQIASPLLKSQGQNHFCISTFF